jgi:hypothetical protein
LGLALDKYAFYMFQPKNLAKQLRNEKDPDIEKTYHFIQRWILDNYVSFKTALYLFYIIILIVSQIIEFNPALVDEELGVFILASRYSILFLMAFDMLIGQFSKDRDNTKKLSEELRKHFEG